MKIRTIATAAFLLSATAFTTVAMAEKIGVVVIGSDGVISEIEFPQLDRMEIGADALTLTDVSGKSTSVDYADIERVEIGTAMTGGSGVSDIASDGTITAWPVPVKSEFNVAGAPEGTQVIVYNLAGGKVAAGTTGSGTLTLDLSGLNGGTYVVTVGKYSFKIIKE